MSIHLCHARCCDTAVPPKLFMCKPHWMRVPKHLRDLIWKFYRPGQEVDKRPSRRYLEITEQAINAVALAEILTQANRVMGKTGAFVWLHRPNSVTNVSPYEALRTDGGYKALMVELQHHQNQPAVLVRSI